MDRAWQNIPVFDPHRKAEVVVFKAKRDNEVKEEKPAMEKVEEKSKIKPKVEEKKDTPNSVGRAKPKLEVKVEKVEEKPKAEKPKAEEKRKASEPEVLKEKIDLSAVTGKKPDEPEKSKRIKFEKGSTEAIEWGKAMAEKRKLALDKRREALALASQTTG